MRAVGCARHHGLGQAPLVVPREVAAARAHAPAEHQHRRDGGGRHPPPPVGQAEEAHRQERAEAGAGQVEEPLAKDRVDGEGQVGDRPPGQHREGVPEESRRVPPHGRRQREQGGCREEAGDRRRLRGGRHHREVRVRVVRGEVERHEEEPEGARQHAERRQHPERRRRRRGGVRREGDRVRGREHVAERRPAKLEVADDDPGHRQAEQRLS